MGFLDIEDTRVSMEIKSVYTEIKIEDILNTGNDKNVDSLSMNDAEIVNKVSNREDMSTVLLSHGIPIKIVGHRSHTLP